MMSLYPWQHSSSRKSLVVHQRTVPRQNTSEVSGPETPLCALFTSFDPPGGESRVSAPLPVTHAVIGCQGASIRDEPKTVLTAGVLQVCGSLSPRNISQLFRNSSTKPLTLKVLLYPM